MLSYLGSQAIKEKYLARVRAHAAAGEIVQRQYWGGGKGCGIGCVVHVNNSAHAAWAEEIGPEWLARVVDDMFEGLLLGRARQFTLALYEAIPVGADLDPVRWEFSSFVLGEIDALLCSVESWEAPEVAAAAAVEAAADFLRRPGEVAPSLSREMLFSVTAASNRVYDAVRGVSDGSHPVDWPGLSKLLRDLAVALVAYSATKLTRIPVDLRCTEQAVWSAVRAAVAACKSDKVRALPGTAPWSAFDFYDDLGIQDGVYAKYADKLVELLRAVRSGTP